LIQKKNKDEKFKIIVKIRNLNKGRGTNHWTKNSLVFCKGFFMGKEY
jgi:hypothetical protein